MVYVHCEGRNITKAESLLRYFAEKFQVYDSASYYELARVLCGDGDVDKFMKLQDNLQQVRFFTFKYLIDGLQKANGVCKVKCIVSTRL